MKVIYKYTVYDTPVEAKIIHFGHDPKLNNYMVWAEIDEVYVDNPTYHFKNLVVLGTGRTVKDGLKHIMSCVEPSGFVWHLYEDLSGGIYG